MNNKPYDSGIILGRFQHFHVGHESLVETTLNLCDRVVIFVGSSQEQGTLRNPFSINTRTEVIKAIYGAAVKVISLPDLTHEEDITHEWGKYVMQNVDRVLYKVPEVMVYGDDESREKWFSKEDAKGTIRVIVPRSAIDISATQLRDMMVLDDRREWMKWVNPKIHKMYDSLRSELMSISDYQARKHILETKSLYWKLKQQRSNGV